MKDNWKSRLIKKITEKELYKQKEVKALLEWVINNYNYKNKENQKQKYIDLLNQVFFVKIFEIDEQNRCLIYFDEKNIKRIRKGKVDRISEIPKFHDKKNTSIYTNIKALFSGKKQEACNITVRKRRFLNGTYKGIDKTMESLDLKARQLKIAENRRKNNTYTSAKKKSIDKIKEEMERIVPGYILKSNTYTGNKVKMEFICNNGHYFKIRWNNIVSGQKCPHCNVYKNEEECRAIFEKITGKKFNKIRPDFLINPKTNVKLELDGYCEELKIAFEYDGIQHYEALDFFGGKKHFLYLQENDRIKNDLCKKNDIFLIRIPYWVKDKESYIKEWIWLKLPESNKED